MVNDPALVDVTQDTLPQFFDVNAIAHETIFTALLSGGTVIDHYPLWTEDFTADWLEVHYREHQAWSSALSLDTPPDLQTLNTHDASQFEAWLINHARHHLIVSQTLGVS